MDHKQQESLLATEKASGELVSSENSQTIKQATPLQRRQPPPSNKKMIVIGFMALTLFGLIGWSLYMIASIDNYFSPKANSSSDTLPVPLKFDKKNNDLRRKGGRASQENNSADPPETGELAPVDEKGIRVKEFLKQDVLSVHRDGSTSFVRIGSQKILGTKSVTLVNLWAPWCKPCKEELPAFKQLFEANDWSGNVRFVPIMVNSDKDSEWAHRNFRLLMPNIEHFLVEIGLQGYVQQSLKTVLNGRTALPVTFVLDCQKRLRWLYDGEIHDMSELKVQVNELVAELSHERCRPTPRSSSEKEDGTGVDGEIRQSAQDLSTSVDPFESTSSQKDLLPVGHKVRPQPICGNGRCERRAGESCHTCTKDCACPKGRQCIQRSDRRYVCGGGLLQ